MPSSRVCTIPYVISVVRQIQPASILDVGVGFGKWGYLFREFTDINMSEREPSRYPKSGWKTRIEGIEGYPAYLHDGHKFIYDKIHQGDAVILLPVLGRFDLIFFGDIIEHFPIEAGKELLHHAITQADRAVMVTTPRFETHQGAECNNELERHRSLWRPRDFKELGPCKIALADPATLVAAYFHEGYRHVWLRPEPRGLVRFAYRVVSKIQRTLRGRR
jgi:hypothetical protein